MSSTALPNVVAGTKRRMPYADTDFFVALAKDDDWLRERAETLLAEHRDDIETSVSTFIELFWICDEYGLDRDQVIAHVLELATVDFEPDLVFQASEYVDEGLTVLDAFHASAARDVPMISSDRSFDGIDVERIPLEPDG